VFLGGAIIVGTIGCVTRSGQLARSRIPPNGEQPSAHWERGNRLASAAVYVSAPRETRLI
jgi:hypothetical protein